MPMKNELTIENLWLSYQKNVLKEVTNPVQMLETKRGFFAGAKAYSKIVIAISSMDITEDQGAFFIGEIEMEIKKFSVDVKNGVQ